MRAVHPAAHCRRAVLCVQYILQYILQHTSLVMTELFGTRRGLRLSVTFSRRWLFYVISSIVPVLTLSLLNTTVFLLPAHSGERVR